MREVPDEIKLACELAWFRLHKDTKEYYPEEPNTAFKLGYYSRYWEERNA